MNQTVTQSYVSSIPTMKIARPKNLPQEAANKLREMILLEKLPAGVTLTERGLSDRLGISRTPLREAIRILANEGLIEFSPSRRPKVADPTIGEITDYLRIQGVLEALAGETACRVATDNEIEEIKNLNRNMQAETKKNNPVKSFEQDMKFHAAIVKASRNIPLAKIHATFNARLWRARFMSSQRKVSRQSTADEHNQIVAALTRRDEKETAKALKNHLKTAVMNIKQAHKERNQQNEEDNKNET